VSDTLMTLGSYLSNATAERPAPIMATRIQTPTYESNVAEQQSALNQNLGSNLAYMRRAAQEMGRADLLPGMLANVMSAKQQGQTATAGAETETMNKQIEATANTASQPSLVDYQANTQGAQMIDQE